MAGNLTAMIAAAFAGGVVSDEYFEYTTLLLPGNGTNLANNNTFLDSSTANSGTGWPVTRNPATGPNAPTQGTFSPFSQTGWGNYLGTTSDRLTTATSNSAFSFGTGGASNVGDFTIEGFVNLNSINANMIFQMSTASTGYNPSTSNTIALYVGDAGSAGKIEIYVANSALASTNVVVTSADIGQWRHFAIVRTSGVTSVYWNSSIVAGLSAITDTTNYTMTYCVIGTVYNNTYGLKGYLSNFRVVKGTSLYSGSTITIPTSTLTAVTNTSFLIANSNRFRDISSNAIGLNTSGSPSVQAFSPFNPTSSWSAATNGGSGYFDGTGDYLSVASSSAFAMGTGQYTIECWVYATAAAVSSVFFNAGTNGVQFSLNASGNIAIAQVSIAFELNSSTPLPLNQWNHLVAVRGSSNVTSIFLNGSRIATSTITTNYSFGTSYINYNPADISRFLTGYIGSLRVVKGTAVYDPTQTTITVPTAPLTNITNTSLLLNFTNAGIYDATSKNDLETVGNAQISTAISAKWGSGSMAFDGNGDYLLSPTQQTSVIGTADFTIEMWAYVTDYTTGSPTFNDYGVFIDYRTANASQVNVLLAFLGSVGGLGRPVFYVNGAIRITGNVISTNAWVHLALCRVSGTTRLFMAGAQAGSNYTDTNNYTSNVFRIGTNITGADGYLKGYLQDVRTTVGYGRYVTGTGANAGQMVFNGTNTLALPTAAFPTL